MIPPSAIVSIILAVFIFMCASACHAQEAHPDLVLHRTVTHADHQTYIELPFDVPKGVINASAGQQVHFTIRMIALRAAHPEIIQDGQPTSFLEKSVLQ
jgi:hypothetical protein